MAAAQQLYEGVEIEGQGLLGLITYMRTDSLRLSEEALSEAREFIGGRYGKNYLPDEPRRYKSRGGAQDAHEAIRPTSPSLAPDDIKKDLTPDQYRLYKLIWERFVACQMKNAVYDTLAVDIIAAGYLFRANSTKVKFPGFTAVYEEGKDDEDDEAEDAIPDLKKDDMLTLAGIEPGQHFTQPPPRYTEASLIKAMEERGVGRPSTYAPTISTIMDREYVRKTGKALSPTPLGEVVTGLMKDKFTDIIDVEFTARMEDTLDDVEEGKRGWKTVLEDFYGKFESTLKQAEEDLAGGRIKVPDEETDIVCDLCGLKMVIKLGRFGRFLACPGYPECKNTKPIAEETPGICPLCGNMILKKKSKSGYTYYGCSTHPACAFMSWEAPVEEKCPECGKSLFKKQGRGRLKPFCINPECAEFLPEDKRGYYKKKTDTDGAPIAEDGNDKAKPAAKKASGTKKTAAEKKPAAKGRGKK